MIERLIKETRYGKNGRATVRYVEGQIEPNSSSIDNILGNRPEPGSDHIVRLLADQAAVKTK